jgi:hypothetical protein
VGLSRPAAEVILFLYANIHQTTVTSSGDSIYWSSFLSETNIIAGAE